MLLLNMTDENVQEENRGLHLRECFVSFFILHGREKRHYEADIDHASLT